MSKRLDVMTFEDITGDGRLWVVKYEGDMDNILAARDLGMIRG